MNTTLLITVQVTMIEIKRYAWSMNERKLLNVREERKKLKREKSDK